MIDIGIDFTVNNKPPRHLILTDWEARLIEACLNRYLEAAIACDDPTLPLAAAALGKVTRGPVPDTVSISERTAARRHEKAIIREVMDPTPRTGFIEQKWAQFAMDLAGALEELAPEALERIRLRSSSDEGVPTAGQWLAYRREKEAARAAERTSA